MTKTCARCGREGLLRYKHADDGFGNVVDVCAQRWRCDMRLWRARPPITCRKCGATNRHGVSYATGACRAQRACEVRQAVHRSPEERRAIRAARSRAAWETRRERGDGGVIVDPEVVRKVINRYRYGHVAVAKLARDYGVSTGAIKRTLERNGVALREGGRGYRSTLSREEREAARHRAWTNRRMKGTGRTVSREDLAELARLYKLGVSLRELSERFFYGVRAIRDALADEGVRIRPRGGRPHEVRVSDEEVRECARLYTEVDPVLGRPLTLKEVGERLGLTGTAVQYRLARHAGVKRRKGGSKGHRYLSDAEMQRTADLYLHGGPDGLGMSLSAVAAELGIHHNAVYRRLLSMGVQMRSPSVNLRPSTPEERSARAKRSHETRRRRAQEREREQNAA